MKMRILTVVAFLSAGCSGAGHRGVDKNRAEDAGTSMKTMADSEIRASDLRDSAGMAGMGMNGKSPIRLTARQAALAGVTFAVAREAPIARTVRAVAMVVPDERTLGIINARISGWVEKLYVNETGTHIEKGERLFELYAPDLVTAQEELLLARQLTTTVGGDSLMSAARRRLALWNVPEETIADIERSGRVRRRITIRSPYRGHVLEKKIIEGQMIRTGDRLFKIADLSTVWIEPAIFEQDIAFVRQGQRAKITLDALPGRTFVGRVTFVHPTLDMGTRTLRVRVEVPNERLDIKPMMYGTVEVESEIAQGVVVPLTAILPTGDRDLAFVMRDGGVIPTDVTVSARGDSKIIVTSGIAPGDTVVASATFLFDSESSLAAAMQGIMLNMGMGLDMGGMDMGGEDMKDMKKEGRQP